MLHDTITTDVTFNIAKTCKGTPQVLHLLLNIVELKPLFDQNRKLFLGKQMKYKSLQQKWNFVWVNEFQHKFQSHADFYFILQNTNLGVSTSNRI